LGQFTTARRFINDDSRELKVACEIPAAATLLKTFVRSRKHVRSEALMSA
jgi:hypothetical protein